jgi:hypothetical protein
VPALAFGRAVPGPAIVAGKGAYRKERPISTSLRIASESDVAVMPREAVELLAAVRNGHAAGSGARKGARGSDLIQRRSSSGAIRVSEPSL